MLPWAHALDEEAAMDHAGFKAWLDRYIDAWRLADPVAIGDLFSPDVRYAFDPFGEAVVGRPAVVAAWPTTKCWRSMARSAWRMVERAI
jgi:hypothetical protein